jgi:quercetin dioxygenase-like cupin family protein
MKFGWERKIRHAGNRTCAAMTYKSLSDLPVKSPFPGWRGKFVRSAGMTFVYWDVLAGTVLPEHSHPHEQVAHTFQGEFEIIVGGIAQVLRAGSVCVIPPNAVHSGRAITDCKILDVFCPVREDYIPFEL